jgi:hypothetical protein
MGVLITLALIVGLLLIAVLSLLNIGRELLRPPLLLVRSDSKSMVDGNSLEGDANGAPYYPDDTAYRKKFSGKYEYRLTTGGVGHNLPQGAPQAFAQAIVDVDGM